MRIVVTGYQGYVDAAADEVAEDAFNVDSAGKNHRVASSPFAEPGLAAEDVPERDALEADLRWSFRTV